MIATFWGAYVRMHKLPNDLLPPFTAKECLSFGHWEIIYNNVMRLGLIVVNSMGFISEFENGEQDPNFILPLT